MPVVRATNEAELTGRIVTALIHRELGDAYLTTGDDLTFSIDLHDLARVTVTTAPTYADVLRGGHVRRWVGRRFFVEKREVG